MGRSRWSETSTSNNKIKRARFEERIIWRYFSQIADAIGYMHSKRIMHRDLKPANIFYQRRKPTMPFYVDHFDGGASALEQFEDGSNDPDMLF